jgi:hypothetical protein
MPAMWSLLRGKRKSRGHCPKTDLDPKETIACVFSTVGLTLGVPIYMHIQIPPKPVVDAYYSGFAPEVSAFLSIAGAGWHIDNGVHCLRLILGGVFDRFPALQIIVGHNLEILSWIAWRADYSFPLNKNGGLKRTIKEYPSGELLRWHPRW